MISEVLILLFSISLRTGNLPNQPFDYEITSGLNGQSNLISVMFERENGNYFWGQNTRYKYNKNIEFVSYVKTAKRISNQRVSFLYPFRQLSFGIDFDFKDFSDGKLLLTGLFKNNYLNVKYSKGFGRENIEIDFKKSFEINKNFSLVPLLVIKKFDENIFYQFKIGFEIKLK